MACVCGGLPRDLPKETPKDEVDRLRAENRARAIRDADALREQAYRLLEWEGSTPCTAENFMTRATASLYHEFGASVEIHMDMWFGIDAEITKYVECGHENDACPDEPDCFVSRWDPVLWVRAECDRAEDGLANLVIWFHENRKKDYGDDGN